jgi:outer membrane lipoprotein LolB
LGARRRAWKVAAALAAALLAACAAAPIQSPRAELPIADAPFAIDGRLSVRRGTEALAGNFTWRHAPPRDDLIVSSPLGQTMAEISGDASTARYELRRADGQREVAQDWSALTDRALGVPLPVAGLAAWIVGAPRANAAHSLEPDAAGRTAVLRQDGWEIVYAYADAEARLPMRLQLTQHDLEVRIVVLQRNSL